MSSSTEQRPTNDNVLDMAITSYVTLGHIPVYMQVLVTLECSNTILS